MSKSRYLGLTLVGTSESEAKQTFLHWRTDMNGEGEASNMQRIDKAYGEMSANITNIRSHVANQANTIGDIESQMEQQNEKLSKDIALKGDNLWFDTSTNLLYLMSDGEPVGDGVAVAASGGGGGGGGSSSSYTPTLTNNMASRTITTSNDSPVSLAFTYRSVDGEGEDDGPGVGSVTINNVTKKTFTVQQGENTVDITDVLGGGTNNVRIKVENSEGVARTLAYTVTIVSLSMTTTMDEIDVYNGDAMFNYTVTGAGEKTVHFVLDGTEIGTEVVTSSGRSRIYVIGEQSHGAHVLECYATAVAEGNEVTSNKIRLSMIWVGESSDPIIASTFNTQNVVQGDTISISYEVYDPASESAEVTLSIIDENGDVYSTQTVTRDRTVGDPWSTQNYPAGNIIFRIGCRETYKDFPVAVEEYIFPLEPISDSLVLEFTAEGRNNNEANPGTWSYSDIEAEFNGFTWANADGWMQDEDNAPVLRFLPGDTMTIPFKPFATDARETGYTIEVEMATRDVRDYESLVLTCMNGGTGFQIASQSASLASEQSSVSMLFKEDSRINVTFVVEQKNLNRFIYIYINGIMCGITQYATADNFAQPNPVGITIGANSCGLDLYHMRFYNRGLNRAEQLDNFIVSRTTLAERQNAYVRNSIMNESDEVDVTKLPSTLPYMVISCPELPQSKGDKKTGVSISFTDPANSAKSFTATGAEIDVQGTSSAVYPVKNLKLKFKGGFTTNGQSYSKYALFNDSIPVSTFCIKVDYASCEGANNVELVELYERVCKEQGMLTPPQVENAAVRQGISGRPIALFWHDTVNNSTVFVGKANFNNDKSTENVFGFDQYPNAESWEFRNNTTNRCLFKSNDFTSMGTDKDGKPIPAWQNDLEARYPEDSTDYTRLKRVFDFVVAHDRDTVTTEEEKQAMLDDFEEHFEEYFDKDLTLFYYLFTEVFLMVDSRAKNMFLTTFDGTHWMPIPYDMDTALGINNEGELSFEYDLEDTDSVNGEQVYNGQSSVLWNNVRDAFDYEIGQMYNTLRSGQVFKYEVVQKLFEDHQSVWPERLWNEDAYTKYLIPYLVNGQDYLDMLQGDKSAQRDWWLYNAFKYRDSKYKTGDAKKNFINFRAYTDDSHPISEANITITPYSHIYAAVEYASTYTPTKRLKRNESFTFVNPMDRMWDTEIHIYSADRLSDVGDLSAMNIGSADFGAATKLQRLILGKDSASYSNTHLNSLTVGRNELLTLVNVCNCSALATSLNLSGCTSIETVLAKGSAITGVDLPAGGHLKKLQLPGTITNLTIRDQKNLTDYEVAGYDNLSTLRIENTPNVPIETVVNSASKLNRARLIGVEWTATNEAALKATIDRLETCTGIDANGNNTDHSVVTGRVSVDTISTSLLERIQDLFPDLVVVVNGIAQYLVRFMNYDGTVLYKEVIAAGGNATDPVTTGSISTPERPDENGMSFQYLGWSEIPTNVQSNKVVTARYRTMCRVRYLDWDNTVLYSVYVAEGGSTNFSGALPTREQDAQYTYVFSGWSGSQTNITESRDIVAQYSTTLRKYTITWKNSDGTTLETDNDVPYGTTPEYNGAAPVHPTEPQDMQFNGWNPAIATVTGDITYTVQYLDTGSQFVKYLKRNMTAYTSSTATKIADNAFYKAAALVSVDTTATSIGANAFNGATALKTVNLRSTGITTIAASAFNACTTLTTVDIAGIARLASNAFHICNNLTALIIRGDSVATLSAVDALPTTPFTTGDGVIYVPGNLVDAYKAATNWSTFADRIYPIDAYPVTDFSTNSGT